MTPEEKEEITNKYHSGVPIRQLSQEYKHIRDGGFYEKKRMTAKEFREWLFDLANALYPSDFTC